MKKVLIVDDEKSFLLSLQDGFKAHGDRFKILTASNGLEALKLLQDMPIDLLVTDLKMPEMDGFELLAWVSRNRPELPIVVMTAFGTAEIEAHLAHHQSLQYLEKPLDLEALEKAILAGLEMDPKSYIRGVTLATFLQLMHLEKKSCTLKIRSAERTGYLFLLQGHLIDAEWGQVAGEEAAYQIVSWENAEIEMDSICRRQTGPIKSSLELILLDAFRLRDEEQHDREIDDVVGTLNFDQGTADLAPSLPTTDPEPVRRLPEAVRARLTELATSHPAVREFALFDQNGFLAEKNKGRCSLEAYDPAIYLHLSDALKEKLGFGFLGYISFLTRGRAHILLFNLTSYSLFVKLQQGSRPQAVAQDISGAINSSIPAS